jgi:hypothetical protein
MKSRKVAVVLTVSLIALAAILGSCKSGPKINVVELDNKGNSTGGIPTPDWIKLYVSQGITAVQSQPQYKDHYCIIGEEIGTNKEFVLTWADNFSAQQRIGAMLRTNIESKYQAAVTGREQSSGGANSSNAAAGNSGEFQQEINNSINAVVNVSYSGAQRESDWWVLNRRYDPDQKDVYSDEYTAYVMYTIRTAELNRQIASALETSVAKDSILYDITIQLAKDILLNGVDYLDPRAE